MCNLLFHSWLYFCMHEVFICLLFSSNLSRFIGKLKFIDSFLMRKKYGNIIILTIVYIEEKKIIIIFLFGPPPIKKKKKIKFLALPVVWWLPMM